MKKLILLALTSLFLLALPDRASPSGYVTRSAVSEYVYLEIGVGLKIQGGSPRMRSNALEENTRRLKNLQVKADSMAEKINSAVADFAESATVKIEFKKIESAYGFYNKYMSGYSKFPTFHSDEEAAEQLGRKCYFRLTEYPTVVIRFSKLPDLKHLRLLRDVVKKAIGKQE